MHVVACDSAPATPVFVLVFLSLFLVFVVADLALTTVEVARSAQKAE